jgi:hypothetical protein
MSYILEPVTVEIDKEVDEALYEEGIDVRGISITHNGSEECRRVALKLVYDKPHNEGTINSNYERFREGLKRACDKLARMNPMKYRDTFHRLLEIPTKEGTFKEYVDPDLAETLI